MKIVVLDGYGLNPGDLSWEEMRALGELTVYDRTAPAELLERSAGAEVLITNKTVITAEDMAALPALKYIGVLATGYNIVDIQAAKARGIIVTNIPAYSTASVAQMVFAHILMIVHFVGEQDSPYYKSDTFMDLLRKVTQNPGRFVLKQHNNRLAMTVRNVKDIEDAYKTLQQL